MSDPAQWAERLDPNHPVLITGAAGFIGYFLAERLLQAGIPVLGLDNLNDYYDPALKLARLDLLRQHEGFAFEEMDLADRDGISGLFDRHRPRHVVNLGAQAGVRYSLDNPRAYVRANVMGHLNILEFARHSGTVAHIAYASSSSVYGGSRGWPVSRNG